MLMQQEFLYTPGPTPIPERVKQAMNQPMIGHRGSKFPELLKDVAHRLKPIFGSEHPVMILAASGTGALETAAANTIGENDDVVVIVSGSFGERFATICEALGANVHRLEIEWGKACQPEQLEHFLKSLDRKVKAVIATYCETSTGVLHPIKDLGEVVQRVTDALYIVDGVSCIGAVPVNMKDWHIDILVTGSQKAMMLPPGLAFVAVSERAKQVIQSHKSRRFYFDLNRYFASFEKEYSTPFTPAISLIFGVQEVCNMIEEEGFDQVIARHQLLKTMTREGVKALGLGLLTSEEDASPTVTAVLPNEVPVKEITTYLRDKFSITVGGGQHKLKGKIFRIGHMGYCTPFDVLRVLNALELTITQLEKRDVLGVATKKAQEVWFHHV